MKLTDKEGAIMILGMFVIMLAFIYIFCCTFLDIPNSGQRIADTAVGLILGSVVTIIAYYFGSSAGIGHKVEND